MSQFSDYLLKSRLTVLSGLINAAPPPPVEGRCELYEAVALNVDRRRDYEVPALRPLRAREHWSSSQERRHEAQRQRISRSAEQGERLCEESLNHFIRPD